MGTNNLKKIYILHGWAYETSKWEPFLKSLKKEGVEGVILKIPGLTAPLETSWNLNDYVNWLDSKIPNSKDGVSILGHSNGGRIALSYTLTHPEKVKKLFLIDSAGIYRKEFFSRTKRNIFKGLSSIGKKIAPENMRFILYKMAKEHDYEKADPVLRETMKNLIAVDLQPNLSKITIPTVIIWGKKDKITPFKDAATIHMLIKDSKLFSIETAYHSPQFTHVPEVSDIVLKNLK